MTEQANKLVGDYQILNELGSGGMGRVYRVRNVISDRIEAMKVLLPDLAGREELAARFLREIKLMASLNHPNIAALRTAFTADNQLIMIMEYVEGTTLAALLEKGPIPAADAVNYIDQALDALSYAHQQHVIHRDIKPANMMLTPQGVIKLMDFGIARSGDEHSLTMTGTTLGSLGYMSPEQIRGEPTDARSDVYSVGVSLYEMVTGQRPFRAQSDYGIMAAHANEMPKPPAELQPGLPASLNDLIFMAIAKDPAKRFQTAAAFRNALSSVAKSLPARPAVAPSAALTIDTLIPPAVVQTPAVAVASHAPVPAPAPAQAGVAAAANTPSIPIPPPAPTSGHRGLYMTLGALIVLAVLVLAGIYVPRYSRTHATAPPPAAASSAANTTSPAAQGPDQQAPSSVSQPTPASPNPMSQSNLPAGVVPAAEITNSANNSAPANSSPSQATSNDVPANPAPSRSSVPHSQKRSAKNPAAAPAPDADAAPAPGADAASNPPEPANNSAALDEMEHELDQLSNRVAAVNGSLDRLQEQQAASGFGLRGDMAARQASMKNNLSKAQEAAERGDLQRAGRYASQTQSDVEVLEHFLGH